MRVGKFKINHYINYMVIGLITLVMGIISLAGGRFDNSLLFLVEKIAISIILAVSLSLVVGFLGELSLGHAGFMCVGAYLGGKVAAMLAKDTFKALKSSFDSTEVGGAPLLGVEGAVIKAHGNSNARAIFCAIRQARTLVETGVVDMIREGVAKLSPDEAQE